MTHSGIGERLIGKHALISDQVDARELAIILGELESVCRSGIDGDIVEFGCYVGTTSLFISRLLRECNETRQFHVYDSFEGLPEKTIQDASGAGEQFKKGELAASKSDFITQYKKAGLPLPRIHKGWFSGISSNDVPAKIAFAFLDGDYYESIRDSLSQITQKLMSGATIIVDDYYNQQLPGAQRAVDEWSDAHESIVQYIRPQASLAVIKIR